MSEVTPPSPQPAAPQNGLGTAALVLGIVQFFCFPLIGGVLAIVFGKMEWRRPSRTRNQRWSRQGWLHSRHRRLGAVGLAHPHHSAWWDVRELTLSLTTQQLGGPDLVIPASVVFATAATSAANSALPRWLPVPPHPGGDRSRPYGYRSS